ncbi:MAG: hypothetical protein ACKPKO_20385, partial [Candidatus Fonsibacter sp.]
MEDNTRLEQCSVSSVCPIAFIFTADDIAKQSPNTNLSEQHKTGVRTKTLQVSGRIIAYTNSDADMLCFEIAEWTETCLNVVTFPRASFLCVCYDAPTDLKCFFYVRTPVLCCSDRLVLGLRLTIS